MIGSTHYAVHYITAIYCITVSLYVLISFTHFATAHVPAPLPPTVATTVFLDLGVTFCFV